MPYAPQLKGNVFQTFFKGLSHNAIPFIKCYSFIKRFACLMEEQISPSNFPPAQQGITPEQLEQLKARAREAAIMQTYQQQVAPSAVAAPPGPPQQQVVYIKRQLTVAEIILMLILSCGIVFGIQLAVNFAVNTLPRIEIKIK
jgi:hypothetical protein